MTEKYCQVEEGGHMHVCVQEHACTCTLYAHTCPYSYKLNRERVGQSLDGWHVVGLLRLLIVVSNKGDDC